MKQTVFYDRHKALNAKMVPFAGFELPVEYTNLKEEHLCVRNGVGIFDISHMGNFWIKGSDAKALIQKITSNDIERVELGQAQYGCLMNDQGGIVDDLIVYYYEPDKYMMVVNASNIEKDFEHIRSQNTFQNVVLENSSDITSQVALQGPSALSVLQGLVSENLSELKPFRFKPMDFPGCKDQVIVSNLGYTGAGGFEINFYNNDALTVWDAILEAGKPYNLQPIGLAARDTLRLEKGYMLYGNDIDDTTSPLEAGLGWCTRLTPENNFIGKEYVEQVKASGCQKRLVGFVMEERAIPRTGYEILHGDAATGRVTSGGLSPCLEKGIGLGYVETPYATEGTEIRIQIRRKQVPARIVKLPFV